MLKLLHNCEDLYHFYSLSAVHSYDLYHINFTLLWVFVVDREAEAVHKNLRHNCWNVWYDVYLLSEEPSVSGVRRSSSPPFAEISLTRHRSNVEHRPLLSSPSTLKKSHKVYCYISHKVKAALQNATCRLIGSWVWANFEPPVSLLQQKITALVSDWLPAVVNKSTDTRSWREPSRNTNTRSLVRLLVNLGLSVTKKQIAYSFPLSLLLLITDVRNCKWNNKRSELFHCTAFEHFMASSVVNKSKDKWKLCAIC